MRTLLAVLLLSGSAWAGVYEVKVSTMPFYELKFDVFYRDETVVATCTMPKDDCKWLEDLAHALNKAHRERRRNNFEEASKRALDAMAKPECVPCPEKGCSE